MPRFHRNGVDERYRLWLLKKSVFLKTAKISGIENVYPRRERRLWGFLTQSFSEHFSRSEFFNSHACSRQLELNCRDYSLFGYFCSLENLPDSAASVREQGGNEM